MRLTFSLIRLTFSLMRLSFSLMRLSFSLIAILLLIVAPAWGQDGGDLSRLAASFVALSLSSPAAVVVYVETPDGVWTGAAGMADDQRPARIDDPFRIASMSKTFVAAAALLLAEQGVWDLDDPAADYLPAEVVERVANANHVTLRQLLAMRSGIDDYLGTDEFWSAIEDDPSYNWTADEAITYAYDLPPLFSPGKDGYYSNTNYLLLQLAMETATGQPQAATLRELILDPLGLDDTFTQGAERGSTVLAYEDWDLDGAYEEVSGINDGFGLGDGALVSTAPDVAAFYRALLRDRTLLTLGSLAQMQTFLPDEDGEDYGLGLARWDTLAGSSIGHSGAVTGFSSIGAYLPELDTIVIGLCADATCSVDVLAEEAVLTVAAS